MKGLRLIAFLMISLVFLGSCQKINEYGDVVNEKLIEKYETGAEYYDSAKYKIKSFGYLYDVKLYDVKEVEGNVQFCYLFNDKDEGDQRRLEYVNELQASFGKPLINDAAIGIEFPLEGNDRIIITYISDSEYDVYIVIISVPTGE